MSSQQPENSRSITYPKLTDTQSNKFTSWLLLTVCLPLTMYAAFLLFAFWGNQLQAFLESLARGDLLLLCVSLLSMTWNWWQQATKRAQKKDQDKDTLGHALATGSWVLAVFLAMVYGGLLIFSLPNMPSLGQPIYKAVFCSVSTGFVVAVCGFQYYRLLSQGRL